MCMCLYQRDRQAIVYRSNDEMAAQNAKNTRHVGRLWWWGNHGGPRRTGGIDLLSGLTEERGQH